MEHDKDGMQTMMHDMMKESMRDMMHDMMHDMMMSNKNSEDMEEEESTEVEVEIEDECMEEDEKEDMKKSKGMDAVLSRLDSVQKELKAIKAKPAMDQKEVFASIANRDQLAGKLSRHVGTFDHCEMTLQEVAKYGVEKLSIPCVDGQEQIVLNAWLHNRPTHDSGFVIGRAMDSKQQDVLTELFGVH